MRVVYDYEAEKPRSVRRAKGGYRCGRLRGLRILVDPDWFPGKGEGHHKGLQVPIPSRYFLPGAARTKIVIGGAFAKRQLAVCSNWA